MIKYIKNMNIKSKIVSFCILILFIIFIFFVCLWKSKVEVTERAYDLISINYEVFNYPDTIYVHSCYYSKIDSGEEMLYTKVSAENAFGQKNYEYMLFFDNGAYTVDYLMGSNDDLTKKLCNKNNVNLFALNFMIGQDW